METVGTVKKKKKITEIYESNWAILNKFEDSYRKLSSDEPVQYLNKRVHKNSVYH